MALPLQAVIAIAITITTILEHIIAYVQEIPETTRKATQAVKSMTIKISHNKLFQNIKKSYKTAVLAITSDQYDGPYQSYKPAANREFGAVGTPAFDAKMRELAVLFAHMSQLCQRLGLSIPAHLHRPPFFKH